MKKGGAVYICGSIDNSDEQDEPNLLNSIEMDCIYIVDCIFNENKASTGSAIFTDENKVIIDSFNITNSKFINNAGNNNDGQMMIESTSKKFSFENNVVEYTQSKTIGALEIKITESAVLIDSTFTNCKLSDLSSVNFMAFESSTPSLDMINCTFTDCETNEYVVLLQNGGITTINDCLFVFTNSQTACSGLNIDSPSVVSISNCIFEKNKNKKIENAGCLFIHRETGTIENIYLNNISFDCCSGSTFNTIYVSGKCAIIDQITNINIHNIENTKSDTYIFGFNTPDVDLIFENSTFNNCKSNNENGGGIGSKLVSKDKISFINCHFFDNYCNHNGGAFQYGSSSNQSLNIILEFQNCNFTRNKTPNFGGALSIQTQHNIQISGCTFLQNRAGYKDESEHGLGGALYINPNIKKELSFIPEISIQNNIFVENRGANAHAIYITNSKNTNIILEYTNVFTSNGQTGTAIITDQNIELLETVFNSTEEYTPISNPIKYENGPSNYQDVTFTQQVVVEEDQIFSYFQNCIFDNCYLEGSYSHQYAITIKCSTFSFTNCTVKFDNNANSKGAICIECYCNITISDCFFVRCNVRAIDQSGGIYYDPTKGDEFFENMIFTNNTFDEMAGVNSRCFRIAIKYSKIIHPISDIIIKNCPIGGNTGVFFFKEVDSSSDTYEFNNWKFIRNKSNSLLGGGCGLLISSSPTNIGPIHLIFNNCEWNGNEAIHVPDIDTSGSLGPRPGLHNGAGGAIQFGFTEFNSNLQLSINDCQFINNESPKEGGALAIQTTEKCAITNCTFIDNISHDKGGALFIDPDFDNQFVTDNRDPQINLQDCHFINNIGSEGSGLYITGNMATYTITNITFTKNAGSRNSVFYSTARDISFESSNFNSTTLDIRAIEFAVLSRILLRNISFIDFDSVRTNGGAIKISDKTNTASSNLLADDGKLEIHMCTFIRCKVKEKGGAIYATNVNNIEIRNCIFDDCYGDGSIAYIESSVNEFLLYYNEFVNINDTTHNIFVCMSKRVNIDEQNITNPGDVMGPLFQSDTLKIDELTFQGLKTGIILGEQIKESVIINCRFINCISGNDFVIEIKNNNTIFESNTISFDQDLTTKGGAINIIGHGSIKVNYNKFLNCVPSGDKSPSINIIPNEEGSTEPIEFNYNFIQGISYSKCYIFKLDLGKQDITFNHNKIYNCTNTNVDDDNYFSQIVNLKPAFTLENLTFEKCSSKTRWGGCLGCLFTVKHDDYKSNARISFINCNFIDNDHQGDSENGGGAFQFGHTSNSYFYIDIIGCIFEDNKALREGGAISLGGNKEHDNENKPIMISNCIFNGNVAKTSGGAVFIYNDYIESCIIENCTFQNNYDSNGGGNAIYISNDRESFNIVEIHSNCVFRNNYNHIYRLECNNAIYTKSPVFSINCSSIISNIVQNRICGIIFAGNNSHNTVYNVSFEKCFIITCKLSKAYAIHIQNEPSSVEIISCTFTSCGSDSGITFDALYIIYDEGKNTKIENCSFIGGETERYPRAPTIFINSYGAHSITNCYILNSACRKGAVRYLDTNDQIPGSTENQDLVLHNITFNAPTGDGRVALSLILNTDNVEVSVIVKVEPL